MQPVEVQRWVSALTTEDGLAPETVRATAQVLRSTLAHAVRTGRLAKNPTDDLRLPRQRLGRKRYLSPVEVEALATSAGGTDRSC